MRILDDMLFPHPVLWSQNSGFRAGTFGFGERPSVVDAADGTTIDLEVILDNGDLEHLLSEGRLGLGIKIQCEETYYNDVLPCVRGPSQIPVGGRILAGHWTLRAIAWLTDSLRLSELKTMDAEFEPGGSDLQPGTVIAIGDEQSFFAGQEKHAPLETVFELVLDESLPAGRYSVSLDDDRIHLLAGQESHSVIAELRGTRQGRASLLNGVYLPVVQRILEEMKQHGSDHSGKRWFRVLNAKMIERGMSINSLDTLDAAQQLLKEPLQRLRAEE